MHRDLHPLPNPPNKIIGGGLSPSYWAKHAMMQGLVKRFFNEKEVTSTLVMDALFSGCKQVEEASRAGIGPKVCFAFSAHVCCSCASVKMANYEHIIRCMSAVPARIVAGCTVFCAAACILHSSASGAYRTFYSCHQACDAIHSVRCYTRLSCLRSARQGVTLKLAAMLQRVTQRLPPPPPSHCLLGVL